MSERLLASGLAATVAAVAVLALLVPSGSSNPADTDAPVVSSGQIARGKATLPGDRSSEPVEITPTTL